MLRSSAVTLALLLPLLLTLSTILSNTPGLKVVAQFLPDQAGHQMMARVPAQNSVLNAGTGFLVLLAWVVVSLILGGWMVRRVDL